MGEYWGNSNGRSREYKHKLKTSNYYKYYMAVNDHTFQVLV